MKRHEKAPQQSIIDQFCGASTLGGVARLIHFTSKDLSYILYVLNGGRENQYSTFEIKKRSGGLREIAAPTTALKQVQSRLNELLQIVYWERPSVHSFVKNRSILTNAHPHINKRYIFNIDLKDFFPSINFGRVRGLFMAGPYNLDPKAATIIAQIACYKNQLPQGSPCSPIISNMICSGMDCQLQQIAKKEHCRYTRYTDDITFSTNLSSFPRSIGYWHNGTVIVGDELNRIVKSNGFTVNKNKTNIQTPDMRQEVTGLIVNEFVNVRRKLVRQVRAMLHAWKKFGLQNAEKEYYSKYSPNTKTTSHQDFKAVVRGKIEFIRMVRHKNERLKLYRKRENMNQQDVFLKLLYNYFDLVLRQGEKPIIRTEGKTDWMHLAAAIQELKRVKKYSEIDIDFFKVRDDTCFGNKQLLRLCNNATKLRQFQRKIICIFDSDDNKINKTHEGHDYIKWGNNVYSFILPAPKRFIGKPISIEFYYGDKVIKTYDAKGRRLFLNKEFNNKGIHKKLPNVCYGVNPKTKKELPGWKKNLSGELKIIGSGVYRVTGSKIESIALSKAGFARNIFGKEKGFENVNFDQFKKIFDLVEQIISE